ncbi:MAG: KaiC domain-containing protein [Archaeoglobaceae archaeon]
MLSTGVEGLDSLLGGGIPQGHIVAVVGTFGTGKTTLGIHFIYEGLKNGEDCIILSFDEDEESIIENASNFGMNLSDFGDQVQVVRLEAADMRRSMERLESEIPEVIRNNNTSRILVDTISVVETLFGDADRYKMLANLRNTLKSVGTTAIITTEADKDNSAYSKFGILEYICDGSICLQIKRRAELEEPTLGLEIVKMRRVKHSRKIKPYIITEEGIVVHEDAELF